MAPSLNVQIQIQVQFQILVQIQGQVMESSSNVKKIQMIAPPGSFALNEVFF